MPDPRDPAALHFAEAAADQAIRAWMSRPAVPERRDMDLVRLIPLSRDAVLSGDPAARRQVLRALVGALRRERARGRAGHWSYSLDRHIGLMRALARERAAVQGAVG